MRTLSPLAAVALALVAATTTTIGCDKLGLGEEQPDELRPFEVAIRVVTDPGRPLPSAEVVVEQKTVAKTDDAGAAKLMFTGKEGDVIDVSVKCPDQHETPPAVGVSLRRLAQGSRLPTYELKCLPTVRTVVVGVRAEGGPGLPIVYLGETVGRTDTSGAAHFTLTPKPGEQVELTLSTAEKGAALLRPQNPTLTFVAKPYDDFVVLEQKFQVEKKVEHHHVKPVINKPVPL